MPKSSFQKLKIIRVMEFLLQKSDENHPVTMQAIIDYLERRGIPSERKSIYADFEALEDYGLDIVRVNEGRFHGYYVGTRDFEVAELKLLVDSVQSSKFITEKKTMELINKIESLASIYEAQLLSRQVFVKNRIKTMNESIYYNVDAIHSGIVAGKKIQFHYFDFTVQKEKHLRREGAFYVMSPYALTWDDENYYMVAFDSDLQTIKHFRVDKMQDISCTDEPRDGAEEFAAMDLAEYSKKVFGMFRGEEKKVRLRFTNDLVGAVLDRLGRDAILIPDGNEHFTVTAQVAVSPQFFGWVCGFGSKAQILGPDGVVTAMRKHIKSIAKMYEDS